LVFEHKKAMVPSPQRHMGHSFSY